MGVIQSDLCFYGSANMPDGDGVLTGGAVDFTTRMFFTDLAVNNVLVYVSSQAADTSTTVTAYGLTSSGVLTSETVTLNGQTQVVGTINFIHLMKGTIGGTTPVGNIEVRSNTIVTSGAFQSAGNSTSTQAAYAVLQSGQGASVALGEIIYGGTGTAAHQLRRIIGINGDTVYINANWSSIPTAGNTYAIHRGFLFEDTPNRISQIRRPFYNAASDSVGGSARTYYEKIFAVNNNTSFAALSAAIQKLVDPSGATDYQFALTSALNDSGTVANRQTAPASGITAFSSGLAPQSILVPSPGYLPNGAAPNAAGAQGVWLRLTLNAGLAASFTNTNMNINGGSL